MKELDDYQYAATATAIYPGQGTLNGLLYTALGLGEAGEFQGKVKKILRDDGGELTSARRMQLIEELGDILWYVALTAAELDIHLSEVAAVNIGKLRRRQQAGTLGGSGDHR